MHKILAIVVFSGLAACVLGVQFDSGRIMNTGISALAKGRMLWYTKRKGKE